MSKDTTHFSLNLSREMVSALAIHLFHRERPAFGWMEAPLASIEALLKPIHSKIHDEDFNAMDTKFFGYDRHLEETGSGDKAAPAATHTDHPARNSCMQIEPTTRRATYAAGLVEWEDKQEEKK